MKQQINNKPIPTTNNSEISNKNNNSITNLTRSTTREIEAIKLNDHHIIKIITNSNKETITKVITTIIIINMEINNNTNHMVVIPTKEEDIID